MKTVTKTLVYEVRRTSKAWSGLYSIWFNKEKAMKEAEKLNKAWQEAGLESRFTVHARKCRDAIVCMEK